MSTNEFFNQLQTVYDYVNNSPKLAGTFFGLVNYLALSNFDGKATVSQEELMDRFSYRKNELNEILSRCTEVGLVEKESDYFKINESRSKDLSRSLKSLYQRINTENINMDATVSLSPNDPVSILLKCREALYEQKNVSS